MNAVSIGDVSESHAARVCICSPCFACPSSIESWSKRARRREIFDVKLTLVRMQHRLFPFYAHVYSFKQADRSSFSLFYVRWVFADPLAPWWSTLCAYSVAPGSSMEEPYCVHETPVPHVVQIMRICWVVGFVLPLFIKKQNNVENWIGLFVDVCFWLDCLYLF
jgi:hypothetical protein